MIGKGSFSNLEYTIRKVEKAMSTYVINSINDGDRVCLVLFARDIISKVEWNNYNRTSGDERALLRQIEKLENQAQTRWTTDNNSVNRTCIVNALDNAFFMLRNNIKNTKALFEEELFLFTDGWEQCDGTESIADAKRYFNDILKKHGISQHRFSFLYNVDLHERFGTFGQATGQNTRINLFNHQAITNLRTMNTNQYPHKLEINADTFGDKIITLDISKDKNIETARTKFRRNLGNIFFPGLTWYEMLLRVIPVSIIGSIIIQFVRYRRLVNHKKNRLRSIKRQSKK